MDELTERECEALTLLCKGYDNVTIASLMCVGPQTLRNMLRVVYSKMEVNSRSSAIVKTYNHLLSKHDLSINMLLKEM